MQRRQSRFAPWLFAAALFGASAGAAPSLEEQARIDRLIDAVAQAKSARFIRNGREYAATDAATFLREKLKSRRESVHSAADFIDQVASRSSTTGEPYRLRFADGRTETSEQFLRAALARLAANAPAASAGR